MNLEPIKSIVLSALIILSLILTFGIWNYQPNYGYLNDSQYTTVTKLEGGKEETRGSIIEPSKIIFSEGNSYFSFENKRLKDEFYKKMQEWTLVESSGLIQRESFPDQEGQIELVFPVTVPMESVSDLFEVEDAVITSLNGYSFDRMYLFTTGSQANVKLTFLNTETYTAFEFEVQNTEALEMVNNYRNKEMANYMKYTGSGVPIYIPEEPRLYHRRFAVQTFNRRPYITPLLYVLFDNPNRVKDSSIEDGESYSDAIRELRVYEKYFNYVNPLPDYSSMSRYELVNQSLNYINTHQGWTNSEDDEYQLYDLNVQRNTVTYRLVYQEYPVFDPNNNLASIKLSLRNRLAYEYNRPLFILEDLIGLEEQKVEDIRTGREVIEFLETSALVSSERVKDITVGYKIADSGNTVLLQPAWYIKYNSGWMELPVEDTADEEGEEGAMESN